MKRIEKGHVNVLKFVAHIGGSYCPSSDACAEPFIMDTLNYLVKAKCLTVEPTDDGPRFHINARGRDMVSNG